MSDERERARVRLMNRRRFEWHQALLNDPGMHNGAAALAFAGLILHHYDWRRGYAELSVGFASICLNMPESTVHRGRRTCLRRSWIAEWKPPHPPKRRRPDLAKRYILCGGPEDLLLDELASGTHGTPITDDTLD